MTNEERHEAKILRLANEHGKFAIELGFIGSVDQQQALERLQLRRWILLIDISGVVSHPGRLFRVFMASDEAMAWRAKIDGCQQ